MDENKPTTQVRLQKWLKELGAASRRQADTMIADGRVTVNGRVAKPGLQVEPGKDAIRIDGRSVKQRPSSKIYWLLNKPEGYLTSRTAEENKPCIYDLPKLSHASPAIAPVGRLDFLSEGLLLLTNDGDLSYRLCHPKFKIPRQYYVLVNRKLKPEEEKEFAKGIGIGEKTPARCRLRFVASEKLGATSGCWYVATIQEGRNRIIRRMFSARDRKVLRLIRFGFGELRLPDNLKSGSYRQLTSAEVTYLMGANAETRSDANETGHSSRRQPRRQADHRQHR